MTTASTFYKNEKLKIPSRLAMLKKSPTNQMKGAEKRKKTIGSLKNLTNMRTIGVIA